jgi:hypothetical protein
VAAAAALAAGLSACSGITPGNAYDLPLFSLPGSFIPNTVLPMPISPVLAVLWTDPLQRQPDVLMPAEWLSAHLDASVAAGTTFYTDIFRAPPPAAMVEIAAPSGDAARLALGEIVIADKADGGAIDVQGPAAEIAAPDRYIAGALQALLYVERPFATSQPTTYPLATATQAGYQVIDFQCTGKASAGPLSVGGAIFVAQTSQILPEIRDCERTHAP